MNFNEALELLKNGKKVRRTDWGYPVDAYVELHDWYGSLTPYIFKSSNHCPDHVVMYGFTYVCTQSQNWEEVL